MSEDSEYQFFPLGVFVMDRVERDLQHFENVDNNHTIEKTLEERGAQYGPWDRHAATAQQLMHIVDLGLTAQRLSHSQRESLHMICHKIGRIVNGNCNFTDSWVDIAGYAQLIVNQLEQTNDT